MFVFRHDAVCMHGVIYMYVLDLCVCMTCMRAWAVLLTYDIFESAMYVFMWWACVCMYVCVHVGCLYACHVCVHMYLYDVFVYM